ATPHWLPEGDKASAGISVSAAATKNACSVCVSVNNGSASGGALLPAAGACAAPARGGKNAAAAGAAPSQEMRRPIGIASSATATSPFLSICASVRLFATTAINPAPCPSL